MKEQEKTDYIMAQVEVLTGMTDYIMTQIRELATRISLLTTAINREK